MDVPTPLARYHAVLMAVAAVPGGIALPRLAQHTKLPRSTAHRIASALCAIGYLQLDEARGLYVFGLVFDELTRRSLVADGRLPAFRPALEHLVSELDETAFLARRVGDEVEIASVVTPRFNERSHIHPGTGPRPLDKCSSSKAILAWTEPEQVERMFAADRLAGLDSLARSLEEFKAMLRRVQHDGFAVCDGEIDDGVYSVAVPVHVGHVSDLFSIGVVGPAARLKALSLETVVGAIRAAARIASQSLLDGASRAA